MQSQQLKTFFFQKTPFLLPVMAKCRKAKKDSTALVTA